MVQNSILLLLLLLATTLEYMEAVYILFTSQWAHITFSSLQKLCVPVVRVLYTYQPFVCFMRRRRIFLFCFSFLLSKIKVNRCEAAQYGNHLDLKLIQNFGVIVQNLREQLKRRMLIFPVISDHHPHALSRTLCASIKS